MLEVDAQSHGAKAGSGVQGSETGKDSHIGNLTLYIHIQLADKP